LGSAEAQVFALSGLAHLRLAYDDMTAAANYFKQVDALLQAHTFNINIMAFVEYYRFQLLLKQGNFTAAALWAEAHTGQLGPLNPYFHRLALPQIRIAQGDFDMALSHLTALIQEAQDTDQGSVLIKALVLQALAFYLSGNHNHALTALERALTLATPEGYVRSFVDEGEPVRLLILEFRLQLKKQTNSLPAYLDRLLAAFPDFGLPMAGSGLASVSTNTIKNPKSARQRGVERGAQSEIQNLADPLSQRELELLRLVAAGYSNQEIAQELFLSIGTVKKHLNNIFGKLRASSRTQAIARASELDLL
jgi:LuxR family maltose regulon positive regulatory protein